MKIKIVNDKVYTVHEYADTDELQEMLYVHFEPQLFEAFDHFLDSVESPIKIAGYTFRASHALKCSDGIAYRGEMLIWLYSMVQNIFEDLEPGVEIHACNLTFLLAEENEDC